MRRGNTNILLPTVNREGRVSQEARGKIPKLRGEEEYNAEIHVPDDSRQVQALFKNGVSVIACWNGMHWITPYGRAGTRGVGTIVAWKEIFWESDFFQDEGWE
jgi:hypothetical protein